MATVNIESLTGINREGSHPNRPLKYLTASL